MNKCLEMCKLADSVTSRPMKVVPLTGLIVGYDIGLIMKLNTNVKKAAKSSLACYTNLPFLLTTSVCSESEYCYQTYDREQLDIYTP